MTFEEFLAAWNAALGRSRLVRHGFGRTNLELGSLDRRHETRVEPMGGQYARPFYVTAALSFRWTALQAARGTAPEEELLIEVLGPDGAGEETEQPWVRVDIAFSATLPYGEPLQMPAPARLAAWEEELTARLTELDPVVQDEEEVDDLLSVGAWQGSPKATLAFGEDGRLWLEGLELASWQAIRLPRRWDDPAREADEPPDAQLERMFTRVRTSLHVWAEVLDQLKPRRGAPNR